MAYDDLPPKLAHARVLAGACLIDVRSQQEFAQGHPAGALNIPIFFMGAVGMQPNPEFVAVVKRHVALDADVVFTCRSGGRSAKACMLVAAQGFTGTLTNVAGGFHGGSVPGWQAEGLPSSTDTTGRSYDDLS